MIDTKKWHWLGKLRSTAGSQYSRTACNTVLECFPLAAKPRHEREKNCINTVKNDSRKGFYYSVILTLKILFSAVSLGHLSLFSVFRKIKVFLAVCEWPKTGRKFCYRRQRCKELQTFMPLLLLFLIYNVFYEWNKQTQIFFCIIHACGL